MSKLLSAAGVALSLVLLAPSGVASAASEVTEASTSRVSKPKVKAAVSAKEAVEGDRLTVKATVGSQKQAMRATLYEWTVPAYFGTASWEPVKSVSVRGRGKVKFKAVAGAADSERFRVGVTYRAAKEVFSKPVSVKVWRWVPLSDISTYYSSSSLFLSFTTVSINGLAQKAWGPVTYGQDRSWEQRFTPGRRCKSFRALLGLSDLSGDGTSGVIKLTADDQVIYESPALAPGMTVPVAVPLSLPYRFGLQSFDTTPLAPTDQKAVRGWPMVGEPELLCSGV